MELEAAAAATPWRALRFRFAGAADAIYTGSWRWRACVALVGGFGEASPPFSSGLAAAF